MISRDILGGVPRFLQFYRKAQMSKNPFLHKIYKKLFGISTKKKGIEFSVDNVVIGNDVLIAPNTYINCDIPDHSIVFGNPCIVKHADDATKDYINHAV